MSTEKIYRVPCPAPIRDIVESVMLTETELAAYKEQLNGLSHQRTRKAPRTREQMLFEVAMCVKGAMPSAFGALTRNAVRREAVEKFPDSPLAVKVSKNAKWVEVI